MKETFPTLEIACWGRQFFGKKVISDSIQNFNAFRRASKQLGLEKRKKILVGSCDNLKKYVYLIIGAFNK